MIMLQFRWYVRDENREQLLSAWKAVHTHVEKTEPAVLLYSLNLHEQEALVTEVYADLAALRFHSQNSKNHTAALRGLFDVTSANVSGELSDPLVNALSERYPNIVAYQQWSGFTRLATAN